MLRCAAAEDVVATNDARDRAASNTSTVAFDELDGQVGLGVLASVMPASVQGSLMVESPSVMMPRRSPAGSRTRLRERYADFRPKRFT